MYIWERIVKVFDVESIVKMTLRGGIFEYKCVNTLIMDMAQ